MRRMTHVANTGPLIVGSFKVSCTIGVNTHPGATQFTRPLGAIFTISLLRVIVMPYIIAVHLAQQGASSKSNGPTTLAGSIINMICFAVARRAPNEHDRCLVFHAIRGYTQLAQVLATHEEA